MGRFKELRCEKVSGPATGVSQRRWITGSLALLACAMLFGPPAFAQPPADKAEKAPAVKKKLTGRLPAYFAAVVTPTQREEIYKLQAEYAAQMEKLQAQLAALLADRDREVDGVLDPEQLAEVTKKRDEAKRRRAARNRPEAATETSTDG